MLFEICKSIFILAPELVHFFGLLLTMSIVKKSSLLSLSGKVQIKVFWLVPFGSWKSKFPFFESLKTHFLWIGMLTSRRKNSWCHILKTLKCTEPYCRCKKFRLKVLLFFVYLLKISWLKSKTILFRPFVNTICDAESVKVS